MKQKKGESPLPPRATGVFLGIWTATFIVLALFVVPVLFETCATRAP